ncbi:MAG: CBS domain-containing protein, partial [Alphaproteobacteria bacterium]|nr:CBS domain-containing protein [Alphaproteobacteria bacterium]
VTIDQDAFLYVALGRMQRLRIRHLPVIDAAGHAVGMLSARQLLRLRSATGIAIGDAISVAEDAPTLRRLHGELPELARLLVSESLGAVAVAEIVSGIVRDFAARAAELAARAMEAEGKGKAPAPWCLLVLGSGGRGESLLAADQDNALIHADDAPEGAEAWFAEMGARVADLLDGAGIPYCKGGVMAREAKWRHSLSGWKAMIDGWIAKPQGESLLAVDIFYDFRAVHGDLALADQLREHALAAASSSPAFLRLLAEEVERVNAPLGFFNTIRVENGRADLKAGALLALVGGTRALALRHRVGETSTPGRLRALIETNHINATDAEGLIAAHAAVTKAILSQQLLDLGAGTAPSSRVDPNRLFRKDKNALVEALKAVDKIKMVMRDLR